MERYTQFRDKGSGIAPFLPAPLQPAPGCCPLLIRALLFIIRLPFLVFFFMAYFAVLQWLPIGSLGKKAALWSILAVPSIWWIDLQVEGVRKGHLSRQQSRLPGPGSIIAASFTSPIDALYLAAIFDPIFTASYPTTKEVEEISLFEAILRAFDLPETHYAPRRNAKTTSLSELQRKYPGRPIVTFAECTTTNGRGILPLSPSLTKIGSTSKIFPVYIRYQTEDIVTPIPGHYIGFLWSLLSKPTHCIRVRIAESVTMAGSGNGMTEKMKKSNYDTNYFDLLDEVSASKGGVASSRDRVEIDLSPTEKNLLDTVGDALARLGRVKRVGLGVADKIDFLEEWRKMHPA
ncbi:lysophosphatidic acid acyltransferase LOA1 [Aspergillus foveolatus]|uniref:lysophosphatidic acid acyltransferase LOA1 n=1 Tax=Aspergillus foveolatus TaxID=210207 RepID=UPI003CCD01DB